MNVDTVVNEPAWYKNMCELEKHACVMAGHARTQEADLKPAKSVARKIVIDVVAAEINADDDQGEGDGAHDIDEEGEERETNAPPPGVVARQHVAKHGS